MSDDKVYGRYSKIPRNKIEIVNTPGFTYNSKEEKILYEDKWEIVNNKLQFKPDNRMVYVETHKNIPTNVEDGYKLVVFRYERNYYRYIVLKLK